MRMTKTQERAVRAKQLLDSGMDAKEAARECGYKNVNGMMGAIALCLRKMTDEDVQAELARMREAEEKNKTQQEVTREEPEPVVGVLPDVGEVLVGERIPQEELLERRRARADAIHNRLEAKEKIIQIKTPRVSVIFEENEWAASRRFKLHVHGVDVWIVLEEDMLGGSEAMIRTLGEIRTAIDMVLEAIA